MTLRALERSLFARRRNAYGLYRFVFVFQFQEVGDIEKCIALQANIDECRLHAWKHAGDPAFVDRSGKGVFVFAFVVDLGE